MHVVATAGHVDHGKSTIVRALTGMEPDRLADERERGLTIDLGFAWTRLPSGAEVSFVDVPGHVRFLKNMLAGVGAVRACLFVVAADDGWMPQSEEHLRILDLLDYDRGVVALTKVDLVDDDTRRQHRHEVERRIAGTFLEDAPVVEVDGAGGTGVAVLADALDDVLADAPTPLDRGRPRLWIDRSFSMPGAGTVVTGTLTGGRLTVGGEYGLVPGGRPGRRTEGLRVRGLQVHGSPSTSAGPGSRVAVNLAGLHHGAVSRGQALVEPDRWQSTRTVDASLTVIAVAGGAVGRHGRYLVFIGSGRCAARLRVLGGDAIRPGASGHVRLHLDVALPLLPGDRYVLRAPDRAVTVGGGEVLDVAPVLPPARARPDRDIDRVVAERGWVEVVVLERMTGHRCRADVADRWVVDPGVLAADRARLRAAVEAAGHDGLALASLDEQARALARCTAGLVVDGDRVWGAPTTGGVAAQGVLEAVAKGWLSPPDPVRLGVHPLVLRRLERAGSLVRCADLVFVPGAVEFAGKVARELAGRSADGFSVAEYRAALGCSRGAALALLGYLDAAGVTRRRGDRRVAGRAGWDVGEVVGAR